MPTRQELELLQALPLELKIMKTKQRITEWVNYYGVDGVYISFSGGKDSTVLLHIVRELYPNVEAVFVDTGLEYPEIRDFVKTFENVTIVKPKMTFPEVIKKYGYPFISKEVSEILWSSKKNKINGKYSYRLDKILGIAKDKDGNLFRYNCSKYAPLLELPINFSNQCCNVMKKRPLKNVKKKPIVGMLAVESKLRERNWLYKGCNSFNGKLVSNPLSFWLDKDILQYIKINNLEICSLYGDIYEIDNQGEQVFNGCGTKLTCSGFQGTGCVFCGFGAHLDTIKGGISRFVRLKETHPKLYDYCMNGGEFVDGIWQPNKQGLGMRYVIDELNKLYSKTLKNGTVKKFIEY